MTDMSDLEREAAAAAPQSGDSLKRLQAMGAKVLSLTSRIDELERMASELKVERWNLQTRDMIDLMTEAGVETVGVGGVTFQQSTEYKASIAAKSPHREEALDWLEKNDGGDLIDAVLEVRFPREFVEERLKLQEYIRTHFQMAAVEATRSVPWARLTSWFKAECERRARMTESGSEDEVAEEPIPLEWLGASVTRIVEMVKPRKTRK